MDWMMGIGDLVVFASAFVAAGAVRKSMKMKQEVDLFADQVEEAIEQILSGKEWKETTEVTEDTLWGNAVRNFGSCIEYGTGKKRMPYWKKGR